MRCGSRCRAASPGSNPSRMSPRQPAPPILITGLRVTNVPRLVSALGEPQLSLGDLAPQQNQLQIDFVGLGFGSGEVLRYQYLLEGADTDWSAPDEHRTVTYASLAPGRYRFTVRAVNSDGIVSAHPAAIDFTILSPLWLRWWALALIATTAGALSYAGYRYRVARLLELVHIRTRIATDLHDDVGANLTRIAVLAEVASHTHDVGPLASIARIARESVSSMSDIVWAINPKRDSLIDLTRRMRQHADELFTLRDIELRFSAPGAADNLRSASTSGATLLLIFKEAVNNAARHSRCSLVDIELAHRTRHGSCSRLSTTASGSIRVRCRWARACEHAAARSDAEWIARHHIRPAAPARPCGSMCRCDGPAGLQPPANT